ncbi:response regulator [Flavobacterium faecale]|uniref:response regulator n=1 Tax=Flavobacterium faecale TaxID=1355330 RepID=UPI003AADB473
MLDKILCIDDDPITLMLCKKVISKTGFSKETDTAHNGEEALNYFKNLKENKSEDLILPKLIFLDLNMPIMGGWEFLDYFSTKEYQDFNQTKIIVLSSTIDPEDLEKTKKYPMVIDFLPKPISISMLEYLTAKL